MNKLAIVCAASVVVLSGCASGPMASTGASGADRVAGAGEQYCWKRILAEKDGKLYCNWVSDLSKACLPERQTDYSTGIEMARYSDPTAAGRCDNGHYLVRVQPR
jgi:hypothetical protein